MAGDKQSHLTAERVSMSTGGQTPTAGSWWEQRWKGHQHQQGCKHQASLDNMGEVQPSVKNSTRLV